MDIVVQSAWDDLEGDLSEATRSRVKSELDPSERLLWASPSIPRIAAPGAGTVIAGFLAVLLLVYSLIAISQFIQNSAPEVGPFSTFGVLSGGLSMMIGLILLARWRLRKNQERNAAETIYALTDRRAIIWRPSFRKGGLEVHSFPKGKLAKVHRIEFNDGQGDVIFSYPSALGEFETFGPNGFIGVAEVRRVEELVRRTLLPHGEPPS